LPTRCHALLPTEILRSAIIAWTGFARSVHRHVLRAKKRVEAGVGQKNEAAGCGGL
jgi:hypothetical protein